MKTYQKILTVIVAIPLVPILSAIVGVVMMVRFFIEMWGIIFEFGALSEQEEEQKTEGVWERHIAKIEAENNKKE